MTRVSLLVVAFSFSGITNGLRDHVDDVLAASRESQASKGGREHGFVQHSANFSTSEGGNHTSNRTSIICSGGELKTDTIIPDSDGWYGLLSYRSCGNAQAYQPPNSSHCYCRAGTKWDGNYCVRCARKQTVGNGANYGRDRDMQPYGMECPSKGWGTYEINKYCGGQHFPGGVTCCHLPTRCRQFKTKAGGECWTPTGCCVANVKDENFREVKIACPDPENGDKCFPRGIPPHPTGGVWYTGNWIDT